MLPLLAGGNDGIFRRPAVSFISLVAAVAGVLPAAAPVRVGAFAVALQALLCAAVPCAFAGSGGSADNADAGSRNGIVLLIAPVVTQPPSAGTDWTSRAPIAATRVVGGADAPVRKHAPAHAEVAMFSWREILFYAMIAVIGIGGYLAFTGGHGREQRRS